MDNYQRWLDHEWEQEKWLKSRPKCFQCGDPIQDEKGYRIEGRLYCPDCIKKSEVYLDD